MKLCRSFARVIDGEVPFFWTSSLKVCNGGSGSVAALHDKNGPVSASVWIAVLREFFASVF